MGSETHFGGNLGRNHSLADVETREQNAEKEQGASRQCRARQQLEEPQGEDDATAGAGAKAAAPYRWTPNQSAGSIGSP
jgi:hypothetical protein